MADNTTETAPQHARRLGKEYVETYHETWNSAGKRWLKYAFARGYQQACLEQAAEAEGIYAAVDAWEADGDDEALVNDHIDPWLARIFDRVRGVKP